MKIVARHSHLNGFEFIQFHKKHIWDEVEQAIESIDAEAHRTKESKEARKQANLLFSPIEINKAFYSILQPNGWEPRTTTNYICENTETLRELITLKPAAQRKLLAERGIEELKTYNQTDFVKERVAVEVQLGKYSFVAHDLFVKHMAFFVNDDIDVGIEIVPMKAMERRMSSGVPYYERDLFNLLRQGRSTPAVPLVLVGIAP
ncbi:MAG: BglII/BstYI family type II restriction endonuclease [Caulobacter sp.]|nr:BglII/BstYI family type II restriction endonuclease [Caulobacter sp.]